MDKRNYSNGLELPLGLAMAMAQNPQAMERFASLTPRQKEQLISNAHNTHSKGEMQSLVESLNDSSQSVTGGIYTNNMLPRQNI